MIFAPTEDQTQILDALQRLTARFASVSIEQVVQPFVYGADLLAALTEGGFTDVGVADRESATTSALIVAELAKLPVTIELTGSMLVAPAAFPEARGPVALVYGDPALPARFLPQARTACLVSDSGTVRLVDIGEGDVTPVSSIFAYPMGRLSADAIARARAVPAEVLPEIERWWRIGVALEIYGAMDAACRLTLEHVTDRKQFGRPLGSFQAVQHRMAMTATAIQACRWLPIAAIAKGDAASAAMAAGYAQQVSKQAVYDLHQFSGAMGLTLEYPLHLFSYRIKQLQSELRGQHRQFAVAADALWPREPAMQAVS